jgi:hypothetical protein
VLCWGTGIGLLLGLATAVAAVWGGWWHVSSLGFVIAIMMVCLVAIPSRLIGVKTKAPRRDKLTTSALSGALGVVVCSPRTCSVASASSCSARGCCSFPELSY